MPISNSDNSNNFKNDIEKLKNNLTQKKDRESKYFNDFGNRKINYDKNYIFPNPINLAQKFNQNMFISDTFSVYDVPIGASENNQQNIKDKMGTNNGSSQFNSNFINSKHSYQGINFDQYDKFHNNLNNRNFNLYNYPYNQNLLFSNPSMRLHQNTLTNCKNNLDEHYQNFHNLGDKFNLKNENDNYNSNNNIKNNSFNDKLRKHNKEQKICNSKKLNKLRSRLKVQKNLFKNIFIGKSNFDLFNSRIINFWENLNDLILPEVRLMDFLTNLMNVSIFGMEVFFFHQSKLKLNN